MRWNVRGERAIYTSDWVGLTLVDVELPDGRRLDHHVVRSQQPAAGTVVGDPDRGVLMIWRHRFITDRWGWEIPAGRVDPGETPADAARREVWEETGWRIDSVEPLIHYHPSQGLSDQTFHIFVGTGATAQGEPPDRTEAERVEWVPVDEVRRLMTAGELRDGLSLTGLAVALATGVVG